MDRHQRCIARAWSHYLGGENFVLAFRDEWKRAAP